jgi:transcriptional regulator with PAS, ATPase and Fis domain
MVTVNCGALPDTLLEAELFGYRAGAFTDARKDKPGRFAAADGGTIFLDEIGDVSQAMQVRLLRVLQERIFEPLGATKPVRVDVRVIAATNRDLDKMVEAGEFRRDLFYRINVVRLDLPPLRRRREDIPLLIDRFIARFNHLKRKEIAGVSPDAMAVLMGHEFAGNVRELENIIEYAFVLCRRGSIRIDHLPARLRPKRTPGAAGEAASFEELEAWYLAEALERHGWNRQRTAEALGIHKTTLWRRIRRLGIKPPKKDGRSRPSDGPR